ncbi:hypothetical protein Taro_022341 [Colocasia esculenta]|uniref:Uncharacterized protein n=1 Tax=Colocasia esculenta TaxID=4460 RepID=A0A843V144_COLES|nr:hypothetical protein [Colocasia esculenta]
MFSRGALCRHPTVVAVTRSLVPSVRAPECVRDVGACVVRLWSHVVAPVFREPLCLGGCVPRVCFRVVLTLLLFEFIAYLTGLNSNPSGSSDPWVAARPSGSLVPGRSGRYSGIRAQGSNKICNKLITMAVPKKGTSTLLARPCRVSVRCEQLVASFSAGFKCELQESVAAIAGCACYEHGCWFARAAVEFVIGLHVHVGVSRRLREIMLCVVWPSPV